MLSADFARLYVVEEELSVLWTDSVEDGVVAYGIADAEPASVALWRATPLVCAAQLLSLIHI